MKYALTWLKLVFICSFGMSFFNTAFAKKVISENITYQNELLPFTADGCSYAPDGTLTNPKKWLDCCLEHDLKYWAGGNKEDRIRADAELGQCVGEMQNEALGKIFQWAVNVGGSPKLNTTYRWGYGWKHKRGYRDLNETEVQLVSNMRPLKIQGVDLQRGLEAQDVAAQFNNYCFEDAYRIGTQMGLNIKTLSYSSDRRFVEIVANDCRGVIKMKLNVHTLALCEEITSSETRPSYITAVFLPKQCTK